MKSSTDHLTSVGGRWWQVRDRIQPHLSEVNYLAEVIFIIEKQWVMVLQKTI